MSDFDPYALAARQAEIDREAMKRIPALAARKKQRLMSSPHGFLRGSAPLFYEILAKRPDLASGPDATGWIVGDMHLENVGAYRNDADEVVFGLNDFDDATIGPLRCDVLRLSTSVVLASLGPAHTGAQAIALAERLVGAYLQSLAGGGAPREPRPIAALIEKVKARSRKQLLDERAPEDHGARRFVRGDRYLDLPPDVAARVPALLVAYVQALGDRAPGKASEYRIEDSAFRVAGNGSLGVMRVALLVRDHAGEERLLELKEARAPSPDALFQPPPGHWTHPAERCVAGARALCTAPHRLLAAVKAGDLSFYGRRLFPQEDKLDLSAAPALDEIVSYIGHRVGEAHARGAAALGLPAPRPWSAEEVATVVDHAVELAGMIEAIYLAYARRNA
jgi:uncharacterized protein (DUF2252 family)